MLGVNMSITPQYKKRFSKPKVKEIIPCLSVKKVKKFVPQTPEVKNLKRSQNLIENKNKPEFVHNYLNVSNNLNLTNVNFARNSSVKVKKKLPKSQILKKRPKKDDKIDGWEHNTDGSDSIITFEAQVK